MPWYKFRETWLLPQRLLLIALNALNGTICTVYYTDIRGIPDPINVTGARSEKVSSQHYIIMSHMGSLHAASVD